MKNWFFFLFLNFQVGLFAQTNQDKVIQLIIKDKQTNKVIEGAIITLFKFNEDHLSNKDGVVKFDIKKPTNIKITHPDYKQFLIHSDAIKEPVLEVFLEPFSKEIEELIITNKSLQSIVKKLITNSTEKLTVPVWLKMYSREFFKTNNQYVSYNDGLLNFVLKGKPEEVESELLVEQNRTIGLPDNDYFDTKTISYNLNSIIENYYDFNNIKKLILSNTKKKFDFELRQHKTNENFYILKVFPKPEIKEFLPEFSITYDFKQNLIFEIDSFIPLENIYFSDVENFKVIKGEISKYRLNIKYRLQGDFYFLFSSNEEIGIKTKSKKGLMKEIEVSNYLLTVQHNKKILSYDAVDVFKDKSIINKKDKIITNYWEYDSGLALTDDEKKIIEHLKQNFVVE